MNSVFKKLIRKEFGENNYDIYFSYYHSNLEDKALDNKEVFEDIYTKLKARDVQSIVKMQNRLNEALLLSFRISKNYFFAFLAYICSVIFLYVQQMPSIVFVPAIILISVCFLIKTYEFVINKYCYIDARIVLVYKSVLDVLMIGKTQM